VVLIQPTPQATFTTTTTTTTPFVAAAAAPGAPVCLGLPPFPLHFIPIQVILESMAIPRKEQHSSRGGDFPLSATITFATDSAAADGVLGSTLLNGSPHGSNARPWPNEN
jgi:hypothetical protein